MIIVCVKVSQFYFFHALCSRIKKCNCEQLCQVRGSVNIVEFRPIMLGGSLVMELRKWNVKDMTEVNKAQQEKNFTGDFTMRKLPEEANSEEEIYFVEFRKGCKTRPHIHMSEQILVVSEGKGVVVFVEKMDLNESHESTRLSKKEYEINKGDIVRVPAGLIHWHGALEDNDFSHIAIRKKTATETIWL